MIETYRASGRFGMHVFALSLAVLGVSLIVGAIYQYLLGWIPFIYLNALMTLGYGFVLFWLMQRAMELGRCRSLMIGISLAVIVGLLSVAATYYDAYYFSVTDLIQDLIRDDKITPSQAPMVWSRFGVLDFIQMRVEEGWHVGSHGESGMPVTGVFVYLVWLIEASIITGGAVLGALEAVRHPYCEDCGVYTDKSIFSLAFNNPSETEVARVKGATDVDGLLTPGLPAGPVTGNCMLYQLTGCPRCDQAMFLDVDRVVTVQKKKKGKPELKKTKLWRSVILNIEHLAQLEALSAPAPAAQAAAVDDAVDALNAASDDAAPATDAERDGSA